MQAAVAIGKRALELRIVAAVEQLAEMRAGFDAQFEQVAAQHQWFRRTVLDRQIGRSLQQPCALGEIIDLNRWAPALVGEGHAGEAIDALDRVAGVGLCAAGMLFKWFVLYLQLSYLVD